MKYKNKNIQISCDGGAATGKSTGAKMIARKYKLKFLSSGLLYRYASYLLIKTSYTGFDWEENQDQFILYCFWNLSGRWLNDEEF